MAKAVYTTVLLDRHWLSDRSFELVLKRPAGFEFTPGQRIRLLWGALERDYSLVNAMDAETLVLCVRHVASGKFSPNLATTPIGTRYKLTGPHGYFTFKKSASAPIFVATGTGVAPFAAMARSGIEGYVLLHGVKSKKDLYYAPLLRSKAQRYIGCLTAERSFATGLFHGRVRDYLATQLEPGSYDFYLCGREEMIRDVTWLVDEQFSGSRVYTEIFY